ncbi:MAG: hypothetical protein MJ077_03665 [Oscillospiraceae bacterium]|nr:hypothetical protein [Oscillospiraceae bacterium]
MDRWNNSEYTERDRREQEIEAKKRKIGILINILLGLLVAITFGSCASRIAYQVSAPMVTLSGDQWEPEWLNVGKKLGIDAEYLPNDWTVDYVEEISASDKVYMALVGYGTPEKTTYLDMDKNEKERNRYPAGLYVMTRGSGSLSKAEADLKEWQSVQQSGCESWQEISPLMLGQGDSTVKYQCFSYSYSDGQSEDYTDGIILYTVVSNWAFSFQLDWNESTNWTQEDALEQIQTILSCFRYAQ